MNKIKEHLNKITIILLLALFPLNQQYHLRPFPSVDGFIIDYLIVKVSLPEILIFFLIFLNFKEIVLNLSNSSNRTKFILFVFIIFLLLTVLRSNYLFLGIYENLVILSSAVVLLFLRGRFYLFENVFINSIKVWLILLFILSLFQFYFQSSVLNSYYIFGEFPYTEDHFHVKQKNVFVENMIPPYGIFSHSNILGGYVLLLLLSLALFKKDSFYFHFLAIGIFLLVGSVTVIAGYMLMLLLNLLKRYSVHNIILEFKFFILFVLSLFLVNTVYTLNTKNYMNDPSVYRRLYMVELSVKNFIENPFFFFFGSGYFNYFESVKSQLYDFELVRFFQPVHNSFYWFIWQYGFLFLYICFIYLFLNWKRLPYSSINLLYILSFIATLDHYILTNHQIKIILLIYLTYSLKFKNNVKLINDEIKK